MLKYHNWTVNFLLSFYRLLIYCSIVIRPNMCLQKICARNLAAILFLVEMIYFCFSGAHASCSVRISLSYIIDLFSQNQKSSPITCKIIKCILLFRFFKYFQYKWCNMMFFWREKYSTNFIDVFYILYQALN
jgi:hypothetical protein